MTPAIRNSSRTVPAARASAQGREQRGQQQHELDPARDDERLRLHAGRGRARVEGAAAAPAARRLGRLGRRLVLGHAQIIVSRPVAILFVGDVVGATGRRLLLALLPGLVEQHATDFVVVNGENAAGGVGITPKIADALFAAGVDVITLGNHTYRQREIYAYLDEHDADPAPGELPPKPARPRLVRGRARRRRGSAS